MEILLAKQECECSVYIVGRDVDYFFLASFEKPHAVECVVAYLLDCIRFEICNDAIFKCMMPFFVKMKINNDMIYCHTF